MADGFDVKFDLSALDQWVEGIKRQFSGAQGVKAGWFEEKKYPNGFEIALNALVQEFGSASRHIPARPFISRTVKEHKEEWAETFQNLIERGLTQDQALKQIGQLMRRHLIEMIRSGDFAPNADSTLKRKRAKNKKGGEPLPLNDTGLMAQSVHTELIK